MIDINHSSDNAGIMAEAIQVWIINLGLYMTYFLIVLFKAIKYAPTKA